MYTRKRNLLAAALRGAGINPVMPEGSFFIMGDTSHIRLPDPYASDKSVTRDWSLCRYLTREIGVAAIPPSAFYRPETQHLAANLARFAFCKEDSEIIEAQKRLLKLASLEHTQ
jgi:aspartate/methionine/tyrosine aminotransferase